MNFLITTLPLRTYLFTFALFITVIIYVQNDFSVGSYSIRLSFLMKQIVIAIKKGKHTFWPGGGGGGRGGGGREKVWDRETMFSHLEKRSPCVVVSG